MKILALRKAAALIAGLALLALISGCATRVDWQTRVGSYTYDQAVLEIGPPDKEAKLTDGTVVAEWLQFRSGSTAVWSGGPGWWGPWGGGWWGSSMMISDVPPRESFLRLIFAPDGTLKSFKKFTR